MEIEKCIFCTIPTGRHQYVEDTVLEANSIAFAKPALGPIVNGYVLIVTRRHVSSVANLSRADRLALAGFISRISRKLSAMYSRTTIAFEHGVVDPSQPAGSCINHAHIHLLPHLRDIDAPLRRRSRFRCVAIKGVGELSPRLTQRRSYVYYQGIDGRAGCYIIDDMLQCQYMRRLLAEDIGRPGLWDYEVYPFRRKIRQFVERYRRS